MAKSILIFPHDKNVEEGFSSADDVRNYIRDEIFSDAKGRYRHTLVRTPDVVVLGYDGFAYGHFDIESYEDPTEEDRQVFSRVKRVYIVAFPPTIYKKPVDLKLLGYKGMRFGKTISEAEFREIKKLAF